MSDILTDLESLYSAVVADVLDTLGHTRQCLSPDVAALTPEKRVSGRIFTMKAEPVDAEPDNPYELEMAAIDSAQHGDVLLVDAGHDRTCGLWGELLTTACIARGVRGVVMTACTRDTWALDSLGFPVFGIGYHPADSKARVDVSAIREPIVIDGVSAKQGDYILGDCDGVVIIPQEVAAEAIAAAKEKVSGENTVREELAAGVPVSEVFRKHGIL